MNKRHIYRRKGQAMIELCLCLPFIVLCLGAIYFLGKLFYTQQVVCHAAQQGARIARKLPDLDNPVIRDHVRGFSEDGKALDCSATMYRLLASAGLLSQGCMGDLPPSARIRVLPFDGNADATLPPGSISVQIEYPFQFFPRQGRGSSSTRFGVPVVTPGEHASQMQWFPDYTIKFEAIVPAEMYQEGV